MTFINSVITSTSSIVGGGTPPSTMAAYVLGALALTSAAVFLMVVAYFHYIHWRYSHIPQPKRPSFFLGHVPDIFQAQRESGNEDLSFTVVLQQWYEHVGSPTFVIFGFHRPLVVTVDPENVKAIVMQPANSKHKDFVKNVMSVMGQRFMGNGLVTILDYETWKPRRQLYDPAFRKSYLKTLLTPFNEILTKFLDQLKPLAGGSTIVPMKVHFGEFTQDVISKVAFGMDFANRWNDSNLGLRRVKGNGTLSFLTNHAFKGLGQHIRYPWFQYLHPYEAEGYREVIRALRMIGRDCIKTRIQMVETGEQVPNDILTHILQMASTKESVDIEELVDDFVTFYVAGQETTANLLSFALILTLQHPQVLERFEAEVGEVLGDKTYVNEQDLEKLQYTEQILKETLRMYGPVFGIAKSSAPGGITLNGYDIPGRTQLSLPTSLMCRLPEYFDDPDTFNPSRFDPDNKQPSSFVYFPFGLGHRACIGKHFALMEAKMAFARLFQVYKIELPDRYELVPVLRTTLQPKDDIPCKLKHRKN